MYVLREKEKVISKFLVNLLYFTRELFLRNYSIKESYASVRSVRTNIKLEKKFLDYAMCVLKFYDFIRIKKSFIVSVF